MSAPSCIASNYCMSCDANVANKCLSCFNSWVGTIGGRYLSNDACLNKTVPIPNCMYHCPSTTVANTATANGAAGSCWMCEPGYYRLITKHGAEWITTCEKTLP